MQCAVGSDQPNHNALARVVVDVVDGLSCGGSRLADLTGCPTDLFSVTAAGRQDKGAFGHASGQGSELGATSR
eukprot:463087-Alexandrium_andersonii.AAC.1